MMILNNILKDFNYRTPYIMLMPAVLQLLSLITQKVFNEKIFCYSIVKSSQDKLHIRICNIKWGFRLKKLR